MDETRMRKVAREEIALAFRALSVAASDLDMPYETSELDSRALTNIEQAADRALRNYKQMGGAADEERAENPFAPDLTMSPEAANLIIRSTVGLLEEGYWPKAYTVEGRLGGEDTEDYDGDLIRRAADIVGRGKIKHAGLLRYLAELDADA